LPDKRGRTAVDQLDRAALKAGAGIETKFVTDYWQIGRLNRKSNDLPTKAGQTKSAKRTHTQAMTHSPLEKTVN